MQTTLERSGRFKASRMGGCMRYYAKQFSLILAISVTVLALSDIIGIVILRGSGECHVEGPMANFPFAAILAFVYSVWATNHAVRFLTRFGTPRGSVWLSTVLSIALFMILLLLCTLVLNMATSGAVLLLSGIHPESYRVIAYGNKALSSSQAYSAALKESLSKLPWQALWLAEWSCVFCFLGACLRRNKWLTLGIMVGLPMVTAVTLLIPAVREAIAMLEADQNQLMVIGLKWLAWMSRVTQWIKENWQLVQGGAAIAALPLSWLIMKETPQP